MEPPFGGVYAIVAGALALLTAIALIGLHTPGQSGVPRVREMVGSSAASLLVVAAGLLVARWSAIRNTVALWEAVAAAAAAALIVGRHVLPLAQGPDAAGLSDAVTWACAATLLASGFRAALGAEIEVRTPLWVIGASLAFLCSTTLLIVVLDVGVTPDSAPTSARLGLVGAWLALGIAWTRRTRRLRTPTSAWFGLFAFSLAVSELSSALHLDAGQPLGAPSLAVLVVGALCAVLGSERALAAALSLSARELDDARAETTAAEIHAQSAHAAAAERAHEARNALGALSAAILTLERYGEQLPASTREQLAAGIVSEIDRLQRLVDVGETQEAPTTFDVGSALAPVINGARALGLDVATHIAPGLQAYGSPNAVAEVVQNLLMNVMRHANGSATDIAAFVDDDRIVVTVGDRGPGVPVERRSTIFERGESQGGVGGEGLGLYLGRRLARAFGSELWIDDRAGGGALFGFHLLLAPARRRDAPPTDQGGHTSDSATTGEPTCVASPRLRTTRVLSLSEP